MLAYFRERGSHNKVVRVDRRVCNNQEMHVPVCNPGTVWERSIRDRKALDLKLLPPRRRL